MIIEGTYIEDTLKLILQRNINIFLNNKSLKKGKLLVFKQNNYHIELLLEINKQTKKFEIPIPFNIELWKKDQLIYFDYRIQTLSKGNKKLYDLLIKLPQTGNNKYYNSILEIKYNID